MVIEPIEHSSDLWIRDFSYAALSNGMIISSRYEATWTLSGGPSISFEEWTTPRARPSPFCREMPHGPRLNMTTYREEDCMRRSLVRLLAPLVLIVVGLGIGGCAWLNPLNRIAVGEYLILPPTVDTPDWLDNKTLVGTSGPDLRIHELKASNGRSITCHELTLSDITDTKFIGASPDRSEVALNVLSPAGTNYSNVILLDLETDLVTEITDTITVHYEAPSFLSASVIVYTGYDDTVMDTITRTLVSYNLSTETETTVVTGTWNTSDPRTDFYLCKALEGGNMILACAMEYPAELASFLVFNATTGAVEFDGFAFDTWDSVTGCDWLDEDTVIIAAGSRGDFSYYTVDISTPAGEFVGDPIALADPAIDEVWGLNVSPDGTMVASSFATYAGDVWQSNSLVVTRIAPPPD
jgi:hypothetical protein